MKKYLLTFAVIAASCMTSFGQKVTIVDGEKFNNVDKKDAIFGTLKDQETGEGLIGAIVRIADQNIATVTDINGDFKARVPLGQHKINVQSIGYTTSTFVIDVRGSGKFTLYVKPNVKELDAVVISGERPDANVSSTNVGKSSLSIESIKELPKAMGEVDIIKSIAMLPGVNTGSELSSGFNVRGGSADQNLILLGGVPIYNPSHLFGFYTAFNADVVSNVSLYKGAVPASFGGRASSVLDIEYRSGDYNKWKAKATVGVSASSIMVEGPVIKDKLAVLVSARKSYLDYILNAFNNPQISESSADFSDVNVIADYRLNDKNKIKYALYRSTDSFNFVGDTSYHWSNFNQSISWNHSFSDKLSSKISLSQSQYKNQIKNNSSINAFELNAEIENLIGKVDFEYMQSDKLSVNAGVDFSRTNLQPGELIPQPSEANSLVTQKVQEEHANEFAGYLELDVSPSKKISFSAGLRYNIYQYLGEHAIYGYRPHEPLSEENLTDTTYYANGDVITTYTGWEPRLSARYSINSSTSFKVALNRMYQYIHLISNTNAIAPSDTWKLSDNELKPQIADQASVGLYKNFRDNKIETSVEVFYKTVNNIVDYKDGAELFLNDHIETELLTGFGKSYGLELYIKSNTSGRLNGWISYTYSRSERRIRGAFNEIESINGGDWYPANYDRPHNFTNVLVYELPKKWKLSTTLTLKSGQVFTKPVGKFNYAGQILPLYTERNNARGPFYHRLDLSLTRDFTFLKKYQGEFNFSVYNVYGRSNPFSIYYQDTEGAPPQPYQLILLTTPFPSVSVTFNFE
ncbi:MAG: carboxypeptidase-like regulatory domain-containing protein [Reichenbachiella sp.]|uniref:TonB-dependent receptor n=1 Tax=Reichenbachiella sp. TaxID=2184521 RepID=UPI003299EE79